MSTRVGLIGEGVIDQPVVEALLHRIASERAGYDWPVVADDLYVDLRIRKTGHGGVVEKLRRLLEVIDAGQETRCRFHVVVLDNRKLQQVHTEVKHLVSGYQSVLFGIAIEELEAWWLADRENVLKWLDLTASELAEAGLDYGTDGYHAERDRNPKSTLDSLTRLSNSAEAFYGHGNFDLAIEFAEHWRETANIDVIEHECPRGFAPFSDELTAAFAGCLRDDRRRTGKLIP